MKLNMLMISKNKLIKQVKMKTTIQAFIKSLALFLVCFFISLMCYSQGATNKAFGDNMKVVDSVLVGSTYQYVFAIYSGDMNQDGYIDVFDYPIFEQDNFDQLTGYYVSDLNGDGYVDVFDYPIFELNNFNQVSLLRPQ
jgi:hypothetical protein